ncbi:MAG: flagellar assembly protein FliX [Kiloniellaceae bacterium]
MKVDRISSIGTAAPRRNERNKASGAGAFSKALSGEPPAASSVSGGGAIGPVDALLALQEVPDAPRGRRQARRRGEDLLDRLDELRLGLLAGSLPRATIERLAALAAAERDRVDDPRLAEILDDIEVRAAVELAKLGR